MNENILIDILLLYSTFCTGLQEKLRLKAPSFALTGTTIKLTCMAKYAPNGNTAEFLLNDKTLTNVRKYGDVCYNTVSRRKCLPSECTCAANERDYIMYYQTIEAPTTNLLFSCKMKFDNVITMSKTAVVTVIERKNLSMLDNYSCNSTSSVAVICRNSDTETEYGFYDWTHTYDGVFIRTLPGIVDNGVSLLVFSKCSYQEYGDYTCRVWYDFGDGDKYEENKTTSLLVEDVPVVLDISYNNLVYEATYFSRTKIIAVQWLKNKNIVVNYTQEIRPVNAILPIHGVSVDDQCYRSTLTIERNDKPVNYRICVTNTVGRTCKDTQHKIQDELKQSFSTYRMWIIVICGVVLVIIVVLVIVIVSCLRRPHSGKHQVASRYRTAQPTTTVNNSRSIEMNLPQYHSTEEYEHPVHQYERPIEEVPVQRPITESLPPTYIEVQANDSDGYEKVD